MGAAYGSSGYSVPWSSSQGMDDGKGSFKGGKDSGSSGGKAAGGKGMCKFFLQGTCTRGSSCAFSHGDNDSSGKSAGKSAGKANGLGGFWSSQRGWEDPDLLEIQAAIDKAQGKANDDEEMMDHLEDLQQLDARADDDDADSSSGDPLPPPASEAEIEEAQRIVQKAQEELT